MAEIYEFNLTEEQRLKVVEKRIADGDSVGALNVLLDMAKNPTDDKFAWYELGCLYYDTENYEHALNWFFKYLPTASKLGKCRAYNAIAGCFYNTDNKTLASYYYDKQFEISKTAEVDFDEDMYDFFEECMSDYDNKDKFHVVDDEFEGERNLKSGREFMSKEDYDNAIKCFSLVKKGTSSYVYAETERAVCEFLLGDVQSSTDILESLHLNSPDNPYVLENLINILYSIGLDESVEYYAGKLADIQTEDFNEEIKIISVLCNSKQDALVKKKTEEFLTYRPEFIPAYSVLGVACYNLGEYENAEKYFHKHYLTTRNVVSKFYMDVCSDNSKISECQKRIPYICSLPDDENKSRKAKIKAWNKMSAVKLKAVSSEELIEMADWCFTVTETALQLDVSAVLAKRNTRQLNDYLADILLRVDIIEDVKMYIVSLLVINGYTRKKGIVFTEVYSELKFYKPEFAKENKKVFVNAYSLAYGKISPFVSSKMEKLKDTANAYNERLREYGYLKKVKDFKSLAVAMILDAGINPVNSQNALIKYFSADKEEVARIRKLYRSFDDED